ncbi:hypothetical protein, partial [Klebsiella pneumoniae]|uniref:hypothetical protein n=1 Tax=Klebsiella pneumoniae TaxID=573 RepID=UPI00200BF504
RAPALKELWTAGNVASFHDASLDCTACHKAGGVAPVFTASHSGYNPEIYNAAGQKYSSLNTAAIDSVTLEPLASQLPAVAAGKSEGCCSCGTKNEK